jgi:hypothetical protein
MGERTGEPSLLAKTFQRFGRGGEVGEDELERDPAAGSLLLGLVYVSGTAVQGVDPAFGAIVGASASMVGGNVASGTLGGWVGASASALARAPPQALQNRGRTSLNSCRQEQWGHVRCCGISVPAVAYQFSGRVGGLRGLNGSGINH